MKRLMIFQRWTKRWIVYTKVVYMYVLQLVLALIRHGWPRNILMFFALMFRAENVNSADVITHVLILQPTRSMLLKWLEN
ncbi:hypothetical protein D3C74_255110 [compost metagenome]